MLQIDFKGFDDSGNPIPETEMLRHRKRFPITILTAKVNLTNKKREQKIKNIWQNLKPEQWLQVIKKINASDFCCGKSSTGWRATFDWLLQPETYLKVLEGKYDNRQTGKGYNNQRADVDQEFEQIIRGDHDNA